MIENQWITIFSVFFVISVNFWCFLWFPVEIFKFLLMLLQTNWFYWKSIKWIPIPFTCFMIPKIDFDFNNIISQMSLIFLLGVLWAQLFFFVELLIKNSYHSYQSESIWFDTQLKCIPFIKSLHFRCTTTNYCATAASHL